MDIRLWHWLPALGLALLLHLLPFLWFGSGSGGEGAGRRFEGLSVTLEPAPTLPGSDAQAEPPATTARAAQAGPTPAPAPPLPDAIALAEPETASPVSPAGEASVPPSPSALSPTVDAEASPAAPVVPEPAPADATGTPAAVPPLAPPASQQVVTPEAGDAGAVVIADTPLQPLAGGLQSAPPSATLEAPPVAAEASPAPRIVPSPGPVPEVPSPPAPDAPSPPAPDATEVAVDQGPLLGAAQPAPPSPAPPLAPEAVSLAGAPTNPPLTTPPSLTPSETMTVGERGEAVAAVPASPAGLAEAGESPMEVRPIRPLDPAGVETAPSAVSAATGPPATPSPTPTPATTIPEVAAVPGLSPTPAPPAAGPSVVQPAPAVSAQPPPPGGETTAATVSPRSEAVLPAGSLIGADGALLGGEAVDAVEAPPSETLAAESTATGVQVPAQAVTGADDQEAATTVAEAPPEIGPTVAEELASVTPPPVAVEVPPEEAVVADEVEMALDDGAAADDAPPLPQVELQSRSAPARSWTDMMPAEVAARLPVDTPRPARGDTASPRGASASLTVDGALASGEASARGRYLARVQSWLGRHRHYPHQARQEGLEGSARVRLVLNRFGEIQSYEFLERTGHPLLDRAVEALLEQASPLPAMPGFLTDEQVSMVVAISYDLR